ncbi:MAG TPA: type II toxin-antitoxin system RelE/ParE family toxin [Terriglobia bacterium]|nr:type II toxin-antitoxin system RelE/ParE family toxin [Terriglobia bacterium]
MPKYRLSEAADKDLSDIYEYTYREFGELQADTYFTALEELLSKLGNNPKLGVEVSALREGYRRFVHKRHAIYYTTDRRGIFVVRILGPGMTAERHIAPGE